MPRSETQKIFLLIEQTITTSQSLTIQQRALLLPDCRPFRATQVFTNIHGICRSGEVDAKCQCGDGTSEILLKDLQNFRLQWRADHLLRTISLQARSRLARRVHCITTSRSLIRKTGIYMQLSRRTANIQDHENDVQSLEMLSSSILQRYLINNKPN